MKIESARALKVTKGESTSHKKCLRLAKETATKDLGEELVKLSSKDLEDLRKRGSEG